MQTGAPSDFPLLIKSLLRTPLQIAPDAEIVSDGLMRYRLSRFRRARKAFRRRTRRARDRAGAGRRCHGLGHTPLFRGVLCGADDGRCTTYRKHQAVALSLIHI